MPPRTPPAVRARHPPFYLSSGGLNPLAISYQAYTNNCGKKACGALPPWSWRQHSGFPPFQISPRHQIIICTAVGGCRLTRQVPPPLWHMAPHRCRLMHAVGNKGVSNEKETRKHSFHPLAKYAQMCIYQPCPGCGRSWMYLSVLANRKCAAVADPMLYRRCLGNRRNCRYNRSLRAMNRDNT